MTYEEKFIKEFDEAKIYSFVFTREFFRKQFNKPPLMSNLLSIIDFSINKKVNIIPALTQIAQEVHSNKFNISTECSANICKKIKENLKNISINDDAIVEICTMKTRHTGIDSSHIKSQLNLATSIKDSSLMDSTVKIIFGNLLEINNTAKNQEFIFNFWKKIKRDPSEISHMIPLIVNDNLGIHQRIQEFHTIEIDCNKIGKSFTKNPLYPFHYSKKIINKFSGLFPESMVIMKEEKEKGLFFLVMKNEEASSNLSICLDYFMHKIHQEKSWYEPSEVDKIIDTNWNSIILAEKLEKSLENKKNLKNLKKTKI